MSNYYENFLKEIESLIKKKELKQAIKWLEAELKMPYIPSHFEQKFINLYEKLITEVKNQETQKIIPTDQLIDQLFDQEQVKQAIALKLLNQHNLKPYLLELKKRIENWDNQEHQALLFEIMHEQNLNINLKIKNILLNPAKTTFLSHPKVLEIVKKIEILTTQNPQESEVAQNLLVQYVLAVFPNFLESDKNLAQDFIMIARHLLVPNISLNSKQKKIKKIIVK